MAEQLSMLDTMFLELEQADESAHMHIGGALIFDPLPGGGTPDIAVLREHLRDRAPLMPRFAQQLSDPHAGPLRWLTWEPAEGYEIVDLADMGPPLAGALLARSMFGGTRMFNLTITNVPASRSACTRSAHLWSRSFRSSRSSPATRSASPSSAPGDGLRHQRRPRGTPDKLPRASSAPSPSCAS